MSGWFSFYFRVCFCKLKREQRLWKVRGERSNWFDFYSEPHPIFAKHSGLCDRWDLTKWHRKGRKAAETENTRKGKNLNSEFLEPPLCLRNTKKRRGFSTLSASVPRPGIEPGWVAPLVFETSASTDSAIWAFCAAKVDVFAELTKCFNCFFAKEAAF